MRPLTLCLILASAIFCPSAAPVLASGGNQILLDRSLSALEQQKYNLGKHIFFSSVALPEKPISPAIEREQSRELRELVAELSRQDSVPREAIEQLESAKLAGRLDEDQIEALKYFVRKRFENGSGGGIE
jgi:hypothetical protein